MKKTRDHGGAIDAAISQFGGERDTWLDLSTGINPVPYPIGDLPPDAWTALPDSAGLNHLLQSARVFWQVPDSASILACPGASSIIARIPALWPAGKVAIETPTYNEHAAAFSSQGWQVCETGGSVQVAVHPNNPDGRQWKADAFTAPFTVIDESFCDVYPDQSHINRTADGNTLVLKSFGKFWGLAGLRLGFAIGTPDMITRLKDRIGPWAVAGPALSIGTAALSDQTWAMETQQRLEIDAARLDQLMQNKGARIVGGTPLFRLYHVDNAHVWQEKMAENHVWSRVFPYSKNWLRLGLPAPHRWDQLERALDGVAQS